MSEDEDEFKAESIEEQAQIMLVEFGEEWALAYAVAELEKAKSAGKQDEMLYWLKVIRQMADSLIAYRGRVQN